jgi:putative hydrolase of the HAD superfamily
MDRISHWVFDLDDTLYAERDYVQSALRFVGSRVSALFDIDQFTDQLGALSAQGVADPIGQAWSQHALPDQMRMHVIEEMRAHKPSITLSAGAAEILAQLRASQRDYAIITDGRGVTQRAKLAALGCIDAKCLSISEEVGMTKLDPARFMAVANSFPLGRFCYVGDNPAKDFVAPKQLGWWTIMLDHQGMGVHSQLLPNDTAFHPNEIVSDLRKILPQL